MLASHVTGPGSITVSGYVAVKEEGGSMLVLLGDMCVGGVAIKVLSSHFTGPGSVAVSGNVALWEQGHSAVREFH